MFDRPDFVESIWFEFDLDKWKKALIFVPVPKPKCIPAPEEPSESNVYPIIHYNDKRRDNDELVDISYGTAIDLTSNGKNGAKHNTAQIFDIMLTN